MKKLLVFLSTIIFLCSPLFGEPLSLEKSLDLSIENSGDVRNKMMEIKQKEFAHLEAGTNALPKLTFQTQGSFLSNPQEGIKIEKGSMGYAPTYNSQIPQAVPDQDMVLMPDGEPTYFKMTAQLTQPLFTWGKIATGIQLAELEKIISEVGLKSSIKKLKKDIATIYWGAILGKKTLDLLRETELELETILADRESQYAEGLVNLQSVLEAKSNLSGIKFQVIKGEEGYASALEAISYYTGIPAGDIELTSDFRTDKVIFDESKLTARAIADSTQLEELQYRLQQAESMTALEEGGAILKPDISLVLTYEISGQKIPFLGTNWTDSWRSNFIVTIGTQTKLWDSGQSYYKIKQAEESAAMVRDGIEELRKGMPLIVRRAVETVNTSYAEMAEKAANTVLAEELYKNARVSRENDLITREEESGALINLQTAKLAYIVTLFQYEQSIVELEYLTGGL